MKTIGKFFLGTIGILLALFLVGQLIIWQDQHKSGVEKFTDGAAKFSKQATKEVGKSYEAVASFVKDKAQ